MELNETIESYILEHAEEMRELLIELAAIPAPSNQEEKRAAFVKDWLTAQGAQGVYIDEACNVVYPVNVTEDNALTVIMAHTDVVFPDQTPLPVVTEEGKIKAPGVGDDTANLVGLLFTAKYIAEKHPQVKDGGLLIVANSGEEGLGNLRGSRYICGKFKDRIREFISFDGYYGGICCQAVGSKRYRVTVTTEGGHSYGAFGNRNAIAYLASMIDSLYTMKVPERGKTTYNVGVISGGTSVNTIAQSAEMLYEYRSDNREDLKEMDRQFEACIAYYQTKGIGVSVELLGERPCSEDVDPVRLERLTEWAKKINEAVTGRPASVMPGSTDCNIPLSLGIPAVCFGVVAGGGAHTREEWVDEVSLVPGYRIAFAAVLEYFR